MCRVHSCGKCEFDGEESGRVHQCLGFNRVWAVLHTSATTKTTQRDSEEVNAADADSRVADRKSKIKRRKGWQMAHMIEYI